MLSVTTITTKQPKENSNGESDFNIKKQRVKTDNLTVAMWHHDTSRELDPHLHTHCILINFISLPDGKWQSRTDENLYYNKMLLGQIYRQELALLCRKLGYEIEPQPKELFEIKGYAREQIKAFSKRHEQIVKYLEGREIDVNKGNTPEQVEWCGRGAEILGLTTTVAEAPECEV